MSDHNTPSSAPGTLPTRRFIARNESFTCNACGADVPIHPQSYRNHCTACLASLHVDVSPGDRKETCGGIMDATSAFLRHGVWMIQHRCRTCGTERVNQSAPDDAKDRLAELSARPTYNLS